MNGATSLYHDVKKPARTSPHEAKGRLWAALRKASARSAHLIVVTTNIQFDKCGQFATGASAPREQSTSPIGVAGGGSRCRGFWPAFSPEGLLRH